MCFLYVVVLSKTIHQIKHADKRRITRVATVDLITYGLLLICRAYCSKTLPLICLLLSLIAHTAVVYTCLLLFIISSSSHGRCL